MSKGVERGAEVTPLTPSRGSPEGVDAATFGTALPLPAEDAPTRRRYSLWRGEGPWKDALRRRGLAAADVLAAVAAIVVTGAVTREGWGSDAGLVLVPAWVVIAKAHGLYDADHTRVRHLTTDELSALVSWATICAGMTTVALALAGLEPITAEGALVLWAVALAAAFTMRATVRMAWRRTVPPERALVVGSGELADAFVRKLALERGHHLVLAKFPIFDASDRSSRLDLAALGKRVADEQVERVILAVADLDERTLADVMALCRAGGIKLSVAPPMRAMLGTAVSLTHLAELPLIEFKTWDPSRSTVLMKRTLDVLVAAGALVLLAIPFAVIALVIRLDSPGPALFRQLRIGKNGRPFWLLKFRTMVNDAESRLAEVVAVDELERPMFKLRADPRVTRVGRLLRRWSIDELPQLVNVVRGDMSLVGPRPEEAWLVERYSEAERFRLDMRPGMTGPMQVHGRGELTFDERLAVEREYVENYSFRKDAYILLRTFGAVLGRHGAF